jgi:hypothetical protein
MKTCLASCAGVLLLVVSAGAIPQTFQQPTNLFIRSTGMNFEDFASDPDSWDAKAGLKGHWEVHGDHLKLTESADVFGIPADEITAEQKDGRVQNFRVVFRRQKSKSGRMTETMERVTANVRAYTAVGAAWSGNRATFKYKAVNITLDPGPDGGVVVEFKRG